MIAQTTGTIDLDHLMKLRLVVGRFGEMDIARWWNTNGQLGRLGTSALRRGFPRTHYFAQARSVFAVAAQRCSEVFDPPDCVTLWRLPAAIEDEFDARWEHWLDNAADWASFFEHLEALRRASYPRRCDRWDSRPTWTPKRSQNFDAPPRAVPCRFPDLSPGVTTSSRF